MDMLSDAVTYAVVPDMLRFAVGSIISNAQPLLLNAFHTASFSDVVAFAIAVVYTSAIELFFGDRMDSTVL